MSRIYGQAAVIELLETNPAAISCVLVADRGAGGAEERAVALARSLGVTVQEVPSDVLRRRADRRGGARIAAELLLASPPDLSAIDATSRPAPLLLALDGVTDPHNLGAIVRSAAALGAEAIIVPKDRSAPLNDAAARASAGAIAHVPVLRVVNLARTLRQLGDSGIWSVAAAAGAQQSLWSVDLTMPLVWVLGSEGYGLRPNVAKACDLAASLPLPGPVGSLNVATFAAVALAETHRQRSRPPGGAEGGPKAP